MAKGDSFTFRATIAREWVMYLVDVPPRVWRAMKAEGATPVVIAVNGSAARQTTMTPRKTGGYRVHVHGELRREVGVTAGDVVKVTLARDTGPRGVEVPPDLGDALREADALEAFGALGPANQRELVDRINDAKRDETRAKRIARVVEIACEKREKLLDRAR